MWVANAGTRYAFKVVRNVKSGQALRLRNRYGAEWTEPLERLHNAGYRQVKTKPSYADER